MRFITVFKVFALSMACLACSNTAEITACEEQDPAKFVQGSHHCLAIETFAAEAGADKGTSQIRAEIHGKGSPLKMANAVDHVRIRDIAGQPEVSRTNVRFLWTEPCLLRMPTFPARA